MSEPVFKIALAGNPNAGKTSLFNQLTGANQKTGNFPGVTVDKKSGTTKLLDGSEAEVIDLPGTYSVFPSSPEEKVVTRVLLNPQENINPDVIVVILDETNLKRNLLLFTQIVDLGFPVVAAMNMVEPAKKKGLDINLVTFFKMTGVPVVEINARTGEGVDNLKRIIKKGKVSDKQAFYNHQELLQLDGPSEGSYREYLNFYFGKGELPKAFADFADKPICDKVELRQRETVIRYQRIDKLIAEILKDRSVTTSPLVSKLDRWFVHPVWGYVTIVVALALIFQLVYSLASYPMDWIDEGFASLVTWTKDVLPEGKLSDLFTDGILSGIGGVVIFIPQIALLFALLSFLEESGYMSRVVFMMDKIMRKFGMNGRSVVPLVSAAACAIPAIMSARTIANQKERLITIFVTPFVSCSARLPVYAVLIALFVPDKSFIGVFNLQGFVLLGLYVFGFLMAIISAWGMKKILKSNVKDYFVMELPEYRWPRAKSIVLLCIEKSKGFVLDAGKIILALSVVLWVLGSYGPGDAMERAKESTEAKLVNAETAQVELAVAEAQLESSYIGVFGKSIEPAIRPLGYDWKIGIALISSFAAREVFVGTMSTIYSVGSEDEMTVKERLASVKNPETGLPLFGIATSISLLIFYALAMQCMSTVAVVYRETKSWKWPVIQLVYMTGLAYLGSLLAYQLLV